MSDVLTIEEKLDGTDTDGIGNSVDLPRLMFIDEECAGILK